MSMIELKDVKGVYPAIAKDPYASEATQPFWTAALNGELMLPKCAKCGTFRNPPHPVCFKCQSRDVEWTKLSGLGTIYTFTVIRHPLRPDLKDRVPYVAALIELDGTQGAGARMHLNLVNCDPEKVKIGDKIKVVFEKISDTYAMPRATPA